MLRSLAGAPLLEELALVVSPASYSGVGPALAPLQQLPGLTRLELTDGGQAGGREGGRALLSTPAGRCASCAMWGALRTW